MKALVTGGCGFVGHHLVEHLIKNTDWDIVVLDKLGYSSSGYERLRDIECFDNKRVQIFGCDLSLPIQHGILQELNGIDYIFHLAAESHVDRSINFAEPFITSNILGTYHLLDAARQIKPKKFFYFSTDEVFGPAKEGEAFKEWDRYNSGNPYAASKAGGEEMCLAYFNSHKVPVIITHTMNVFGERQHPEKFIPMTIRKILRGEKLTIHCDSTHTKFASRFWIHARNVASAMMFLIEHGVPGDKYNIVGEKEVDVMQMADFISKALNKPFFYELIDFHSTRPGHDMRYALDGTKMKHMGWELPKTFEESLTKTIKWFVEHPMWLKQPDLYAGQ